MITQQDMKHRGWYALLLILLLTSVIFLILNVFYSTTSSDDNIEKMNRLYYASAVTLLLLLTSLRFSSATTPHPPAFVPLMGNVITKLFNEVEARVASSKVNKMYDKTMQKLEVGPDAEYVAGKGQVDHSTWDNLIKKYVSPGIVEGINTNVVDYKALAEDPNFEKYCSVLKDVNLSSLRPNELLALYINAYNALCIGHVIRYMEENDGELPVSVTKAGIGSTEVWDIPAGVVGGITLTLSEIEHKILRSRWEEPRIHASIVCASASCPNLRREAFVPAILNDQMNDQAREWVTDPTKGVRTNENGELTLSRIFLWFRKDFQNKGGPVEWIKSFTPSVQTEKMNPEFQMNYFTYNWNLNKKSE